MYKIRLNDSYLSNGSKFLEFDLKEVLSCIKDTLNSFDWQFLNLEVVNGDFSNSFLHNVVSTAKVDAPINITSKELLELATLIFQTENLLLEGKNQNEVIRIVAFDSSYWEVETNSEKIISNIKGSFKDYVITRT